MVSQVSFAPLMKDDRPTLFALVVKEVDFP